MTSDILLYDQISLIINIWGNIFLLVMIFSLYISKNHDKKSIGWICAIMTIINLLICFLLVKSYLEREKDDDCTIFYIIYYIPLMIIYYYAFLALIDEKYILIFIFIIFFDLLSVFLSVFLFNSSNFGLIFFSICLSNVITIPFLNYWLNGGTTEIIVLTALIDIYIMIVSYVKESNIVLFSVLVFDYAIFIIVFSLAVLIIFLVLLCLSYCFGKK